ncbi:N-acetyl-gamma-glutamyl-phosphate reductase [Hyphobacterium sp. HN65]|uniref:N-acetyl-gamma-glutamyl-phosphate reductase n=1 Tax=Hyphobacterium lacteum TaxID=3116575 RepID=A0ABU7LNT5_9PROT|nr:N-acetyl-gamma-glutamyl-phosphate reductase [Hyphobacterium sp. HN65]MEE2525572.1 N-acetyl-gamma-glutamyl-phosphate reductase [Hyphobacterium sp. HN65]
MRARIGLIGGRGYTGREILRHLSQRDDLELVVASSRELAGQKICETAPELETDLCFEHVEPGDIASFNLDGVVLALPNGAGAPFVAATPDATVIVDLSADGRFSDDWIYGLPEIYGREVIRGAKRIANPGCYATSGQLAVAPIREMAAGPAHVFGVSGYSGAGTTPSRKNDLAALADNLMPYALTGHIHEREMAAHLGVDIHFTPHVAPFFSGLMTTVHIPIIGMSTAGGCQDAYRAYYENEPLIEVVEEIPEPAMIAGRSGAMIGGFGLSGDGRHLTVVSVLDNLQKGAAVQALQNLTLALGLPEYN